MVESLAYGTGYDRIRIGVDRVTGDIVYKSAAAARHDARRRRAGQRAGAGWWRATPSRSPRWRPVVGGARGRPRLGPADPARGRRPALVRGRGRGLRQPRQHAPARTRGRRGHLRGGLPRARLRASDRPDDDERPRHPRGMGPARLARALRERPRERRGRTAPTRSPSTRCWPPRRASAPSTRAAAPSASARISRRSWPGSGAPGRRPPANRTAARRRSGRPGWRPRTRPTRSTRRSSRIPAVSGTVLSNGSRRAAPSTNRISVRFTRSIPCRARR